MVWTCSDNEQREKLKETFEHETEMKMPRGRDQNQNGNKVRKDVTQREGRH
jgi:hypothetical protein